MSAEYPEISIIVPAYNAEPYLPECLKSVIRQSFIDWELIIADDGSEDKTGMICDRFASEDCRIRVTHMARQGVSAARNACIDMARGKYLAFIDADDRVEDGFLSELYSHAEKDNADITQCSFFFTNEKGDKTPDPNGVDKIFRGKNVIIDAHFRGSQGDIRVSVWAKLFRREVFSDIRFNTDLRIYEDAFYVYECCKIAETVSCFSKPLYDYVQHERSATHSRLVEICPDYFTMYNMQKSEMSDSVLIRKRIAAREAETALWLMRIMVREGKNNELWSLRKKAVEVTRDVHFSHAPFLIKLKLAGVSLMPRLYFAMLRKKVTSDNEKI